MLAALKDRGETVQHFRARACLTAAGIVGQVTGLPGRHLDAWLMPRFTIREVFARGVRNSSFAIVEGTLENIEPKIEWGSRAANRFEGYDRPGGLAPISAALDLPCVAIVDASDPSDYHFPVLHPQVDAILLDGLPEPSAFEPLRLVAATALKKPVVGAVDLMPGLRNQIRDFPADCSMPEEWFQTLAKSFSRYADWEAIESLARSRELPDVSESQLLPICKPFRVAYAQDQAFGIYFPDTLETLELLGAELIEFSTLSDEKLAPDVELVMIGGGTPDLYIKDLVKNHSMMNALRTHVCAGHRIYSECGGTAYLGGTLVIDGNRRPGVGIYPFEAELKTDPGPPVPVEREMIRDSWLGPKGTRVRGYRSQRWKLSPAPELCDCPSKSGVLTNEKDAYFRKQAVGTLVHLHLAALNDVVAAFAHPHRGSVSAGASG